MTRKYYLDNLKVFLNVLVIFHHARQAYCNGANWTPPFYSRCKDHNLVKNIAEISYIFLFKESVESVSQFHMNLTNS